MKGLFAIVADFGHRSFEVQPYNDTNAAKTQIQKHRVVSPSPFFIFSGPAGHNQPTVPQQYICARGISTQTFYKNRIVQQ